MNFEEMYYEARKMAKMKVLNKYSTMGTVACIGVTSSGNVYKGKCAVLPCAMGFCAETAMMAQMILNDETQLKQIIAVHESGRIISPCGRCREFLYQMNYDNLDCDVMIEGKKIVKLRELLPELWSLNVDT